MLNSFVMHAVGNLSRNPELLTRENIPYVRFCCAATTMGSMRMGSSDPHRVAFGSRLSVTTPTDSSSMLGRETS